MALKPPEMKLGRTEPGDQEVHRDDNGSQDPTYNISVAYAFSHFYHMDYANAAIHEAVVRFSPVTFGLADHLYNGGNRHREVLEVVADRGKYELDKGR